MKHYLHPKIHPNRHSSIGETDHICTKISRLKILGCMLYGKFKIQYKLHFSYRSKKNVIIKAR